MAHDETNPLVERIEPIAHDAGQLVELHAALIKSEFRQAAGAVAPALTSIGAGAGLAATGGLFAALALVHGLQRSTRLPLWGCYGLVGGLLGAAGAGLAASGVKRLGGIDLVPRETIATLKEDLEWALGKK
ncbi:phage holin family protein [Paludisphaera mucosa]|uniref:Phage holin family protein n=1 Tax=Paludisphaera mucosa TaxID=3030827 RepID=A0ABT6FAY2_9BACT|nr:phage holin family protein [Paludisphaera mucosa]MDG3004543.1 phage holin family protein [Paludisphaera mucosa]